MRKIILDQPERIGKWVAEKVGQNAPWGAFTALGVEDENGDLIAGVVYDGYVKNARISMHCAGVGKKWLTKRFLWMCFDYPFNQLGVNVIINPVDSENIESAKFTEHCGFKEVARVEGGAADSDLIVYVLYKKDCKWIRI